ncbi:MAG: hypothetical protein D6796_13355 [Caldilineae bacterium]|nr:MAG: hypothetical protein D6796_13355 [Caldilineae bacterium]
MASESELEAALAHAQAVKSKYEAELLRKANVVGVGVGFKSEGGKATDRVAIVVSVRKKVRRAALAPEDVIPPVLEGVPVDVVETGVLRAL